MEEAIAGRFLRAGRSNDTYDFKHLMDDQAAARVLVGAVLGEEW